MPPGKMMVKLTLIEELVDNCSYLLDGLEDLIEIGSIAENRVKAFVQQGICLIFAEIASGGDYFGTRKVLI